MSTYWRELDPAEQEWAQLQPFLKSRGYLLRRRYQPNWKPAEKKNSTDETTRPNPYDNVLDAIRASDRSPVILKRIKSQATELVVHLRMLDFPNSSRHVVPIYDSIILPGTDEYLIIVLPLLRRIEIPTFENLYEALDCALQLVEGLAHLHENRGIHRDLDDRNILMQADSLYPKGWHPIEDIEYHPGDPTSSKAVLQRAPYITRSLAPPKYLFADFGISLALRPGEPHHRLGNRGSRFPPEMESNAVVDTYAVDIWALGDVLKGLMSRHQPEYQEIETVLEPFVNHLMNEDPKRRPTAQQSLKDLRRIIESVGDAQLRGSLKPKLRWTFSEVKFSILAILQGQGDEKVLFAKLRGREPPTTLSFAEGSARERLELSRRVYKFLLHYGNGGNVLQWLSPKHSSK